jgi:hypothetical protein
VFWRHPGRKIIFVMIDFENCVNEDFKRFYLIKIKNYY